VGTAVALSAGVPEVEAVMADESAAYHDVFFAGLWTGFAFEIGGLVIRSLLMFTRDTGMEK
jgi:hypothetical protein